MSHDALSPAAPSPQEAAAVLALAESSTRTTRLRGARWVRTYLLGWGLGSIGLVLAIGMGGQVGFFVGMAAWAALVTIGVTWASRQGFLAQGSRRRLAVAAATWAVVYGATLVVGLPGQAGNLAYWLPAALVSAVPMVVVALWPRREEQAA